MKNLPVSKKFYAYISDRVKTTFIHSLASVSDTMNLIDSYLAGKIITCENVQALVAFNMVRAELDRAMERSRRAKARAATRKSTKEENKSAHISDTHAINNSEEVPSQPEVTAEPVYPMSRRERRAAERMRQKLEARKMNRSHRGVSGDGSGGKADQSVLATIYSASSLA